MHIYIKKLLAHRSKEMLKSQVIRLFRGTGVTRMNQSLLIFHPVPLESGFLVLGQRALVCLPNSWLVVQGQGPFDQQLLLGCTYPFLKRCQSHATTKDNRQEGNSNECPQHTASMHF